MRPCAVENQPIAIFGRLFESHCRVTGYAPYRLSMKEDLVRLQCDMLFGRSIGSGSFPILV